MDSQYSESLVGNDYSESSMETHAEDDSNITTEDRDLMEGHDESEAKEEAFEKILPVFQKELGDVYMNNLAWMKALKKDSIHKRIMTTRDDYVNHKMFDQDEAIAAAVKKRKFLLKRLLEGQGRFPEQ